MKHPEHTLQRACVSLLKTLPPPPRGPWSTAVNPLPGTSARQGAQAKLLGLRAGTPDLILLWQGRFIGIELKAKRGTVSKEQASARDEIVNADGLWFCIRTIDEFAALLSRLRIVKAAA